MGVILLEGSFKVDVVTETDVDNKLKIKVVTALEGCGEEKIVVSTDSSWKVCDNIVGDGLTSVIVLYAFDRLDSVLLEGEISVSSLETVAIVVKKKIEVGKRLLVS